MLARIYLPGLAVLGLAMLAQRALGWLGASAGAGAYSALQWTALGGYLLGIVMVAGATYALWRWKRGHAPKCSVCAGMLGRKRADRGRIYRRCLVCAKDARRRYDYSWR